jgi:hypothetical protein
MYYSREQKGHNFILTIYTYDANNQQNTILFTEGTTASTLLASHCRLVVFET